MAVGGAGARVAPPLASSLARDDVVASFFRLAADVTDGVQQDVLAP